ncbi:YqjF family protein [Oceanobacillus sp. CFH 90083]|uniref:YqjF family protein n=1 Tax=Oceanobacillus sp. CFH 90083 TaxID=2592336 RepID=UPI00128CF3FD|nr:DUF2071 domain-containing protein [Oceanobacillus sp. CFH 90083]
MIIKKTTTDMHHISPWILLQKWEHLLFIHLPVSPDALRGQLPKGLELDIYDGQAWISIVAFKVSRNRFRYLPVIPYIRPMLQLNIRTYVKRKGEGGVYFFTMDTNKLSVVLGGKIVKAPFLHADMKMSRSGNTYHIDSSRKGKIAAKFQASYTPAGEAFYPEKQSLDYWLLERYVFWSDQKGQLYRGDIQHEPWKVKDVKVKTESSSLSFFLSKEAIEQSPVVHYAHCKLALNGMIKKEGCVPNQLEI